MPTNRDTVRQVVVLASAVLAILGSFIGSGAAGGTPIQEAAGGALAADATPLAPAGPAFSIWSVIYAGLVAFAIWQLLPKQRADPRQRRLGYPVAASLLLNAAWILSIQFDLLVLSVPIILALLAVLGWAFRITITTRSSTILEAVVVDGTIGLYLGWVCAATVANIAAVVTAAGTVIPEAVAVVALGLLGGGVGVLLAFAGRGRIAPSLSLAWALSWIAVGRLASLPFSSAVGYTAIAAAIVVLVITVGVRLLQNRGSVDRLVHPQ